MKVEINVPEELISKLGKEAIELYLQRKANALYQSLVTQENQEITSHTEDKEAADKAWQNFNKRGMSC